MAAILEFGHIRTVEYLTSTAAYIGAANSAQGLDGVAAATQYLKGNGVEVAGTATDGQRSKNSAGVTVQVKRHVSVVNYWEASVSYSEPTPALLKAAFPDTLKITRDCRWYVPRAYLKQGANWMPADGEAGNGG